MATARMSGVSAVPGVGSRGVAATARGAASFLLVLGGLLALALLFRDSGWAWLLMTGIGLVAGAVAGRARMAWLALAAVIVFHAIAIGLDLPRDDNAFWFIGAAFEALVLAAAFLVGVNVGWRRAPLGAAREGWAALGRRSRRLLMGAVALAGVVVLGYGAYAFLVGPGIFVSPGSDAKAADCRTPYFAYGWDYEAINYDKAADAGIANSAVYENGRSSWKCTGMPGRAGSEVVASDGIPLAGWYIPAASGTDPTGPTLLVIHGWNDNKSGMLAFAPSLHERYNLAMFDLRNSGQSGGTQSSSGLYEQRDVTAMIDWLEKTKHPRWLGVVANSMGAATSLAVAVGDQRVRALILDSMHADVVTTYSNAMQEDYGYPGGPTAWILARGISARVGGDVTTVDPIRNIGKLGDRPVLLTASLDDQVDTPAEATEPNFRTALAAGVKAEVAYCHGARHGQVIFVCADDWASWADGFLARAVKQ